MNTESPDLIQRALDAGINHLDTAHVYLRGNSETAIGQVLETSGMRDKVYVGTKMYFARDRDAGVYLTKDDGRAPAATEENFNEQLALSLERLGTDYLDILYLHNCYGPEMATYEPLLNALVKAKEAGKARFIGVTTHRREPDVIRAAVDTGVIDVIETAYNFMKENPDEMAQAIEYANQKGVGIIVMKTQGGGGLAEEKKAKMNHKAALKWVLSNKNITAAIPGISTFEQLKMDLEVMSDLTLTEEERQDLEMVSAAGSTFYCQNCRRCIASCPKSVEIPTLMRAYMYAEGYRNLAQAFSTVDELPAARSLDVCRDCMACAATCRNGIDIAQRLKVLSKRRVCRV
jgi:predicted aldo/keto reductase-like oxidoreductase